MGYIDENMKRGYRVCRVCATVFADSTIEAAALCELKHFGLDVPSVIRSRDAEIKRLHENMEEAANMLRSDTTKDVGDRDPYAVIDLLVHY